MKAIIFWIDGPWSGRLGIVPRPRGGDWLEDEVKSWFDSGIKAVVSMLTPEEAVELKIENEEEYCKNLGIKFYSVPIVDRGIPNNIEEFLKTVLILETDLVEGKNVAIHCRQSIGRSSILASSLLVHSGIQIMEAFKLVESARGCPVPDTQEQRIWVEDFAEYIVSIQKIEIPLSLQNRQ